MELFQLSRLHHLDVKWTGYHRGNSPLADYEHSNPYYEIMMVTDGPVYLQLGTKRLELHTGDCYLLKPWELHTAWKLTHEQAGFFWVQFQVTPGFRDGSWETFKTSFWDNVLQMSQQELRTDGPSEAEDLFLPRSFQPSRRYELLSRFEKLHAEMGNPQGYFRYRGSLLLGEILLLLAEDLLNQSHGSSHVPAAYTTYRQLVDYLNENYNKEIQRDVIVSLLDRKYEYLCQIFKKYSGISIFTYVHKLRIQRSKYLLASTDLDVKQIAEQVGFQDPYYFSRLFKKYERCSPSEYRSGLGTPGGAGAPG